jgi:hypothetical protein
MMQRITHRPTRRPRGSTWLILSAWLLSGNLVGATPLVSEAVPPAGYRCRDANGQTSYSQWPCESPSVALRQADHRTGSQTAQARRNAERDRHLAASMAYARHQSERADFHPRAQPLTVEAHPRHKGTQHTSSDDSNLRRTHRVSSRRDFKAVVPKSAASAPAQPVASSRSPAASR